jgi:FAD/FMN-containing dehydrogenase
VIYPVSTQDVSNILSFAHANSIELAVCGAGHNHRGNSVDDGLIVDLRKMIGVSVNPLSKRVTTEGATIWGSVYKAAEEHGLAVVGGLIPSVGVGGFTLNGGLGWLTSAHGVALDNLLEADVVLADGRILTCSEKENDDLFWALRGAGSAFGVVTRFVFQAHEINSKVWVGFWE